MTVLKYYNVYKHSRLKLDDIRGMIRDLDREDTLSRDDRKMRREALQRLLAKTQQT